jgi:hypothetical protein
VTTLEPVTVAGFAVSERRRDLRYITPEWPVFLSAAISALAADARPIGSVRDISRGGMRVAGARVVALGNALGLCIALPPQAGSAAANRVNFLKVTARPVWVCADESGTGFELGYEFIAPAKATLRRIDALVATLVEKD